jgi:hypothetical protein
MVAVVISPCASGDLFTFRSIFFCSLVDFISVRALMHCDVSQIISLRAATKILRA